MNQNTNVMLRCLTLSVPLMRLLKIYLKFFPFLERKKNSQCKKYQDASKDIATLGFCFQAHSHLEANA